MDQPDGLATNFRRLSTFITQPKVTHFGKRSGWMSIPKLREGLPPLLEQLEHDQAQKMGPRNLYDPALLQKAIDNYKRLSVHRMPKLAYLECERIALDINKSLHIPLVPMPKDLALQQMLWRTKSTSAGYPFFKSREVVCAQYLSKTFALQNPERYEADIKNWRAIGSPDILTMEPIATYSANYRTEAGVGGCKVRLVHAAPLANQLLEAQYALPLQNELAVMTSHEDEARGQLFTYMNPGLLHALIHSNINYALDWQVPCISIDYSQFDAHISQDLIFLAFEVLFGSAEEWDEVQQLIVNNFTFKQLLTPWRMEEFTGGVPSGSVFTNLIDSAANAICLHYVADNSPVLLRVNGDDAIAVFQEGITIEDLTKRALILGLEIHPDKQAVSENSFQFNKAYHGLEYDGAVPSENRIVNSSRYYDSQMKGLGPDGHTLSADAEILRTLQILQQCEFHPYRADILRRFAEPNIDGVMLIDYRVRLRRALEEYGSKEIPFNVPFEKDLDNSWIAGMYDVLEDK